MLSSSGHHQFADSSASRKKDMVEFFSQQFLAGFFVTLQDIDIVRLEDFTYQFTYQFRGVRGKLRGL
jgi:hypothetical protein